MISFSLKKLPISNSFFQENRINSDQVGHHIIVVVTRHEAESVAPSSLTGGSRPAEGDICIRCNDYHQHQKSTPGWHQQYQRSSVFSISSYSWRDITLIQ